MTPSKMRKHPNGFSLVEMAVVLAIVALLLGGLLPTISAQIEQAKRNETRKQMDEIMAALIGFATSHTPPRLPCPAPKATPSGAVGAGVEDCSIAAVSKSINGVLPWVTLGVNETDAWGRRFTYSVASAPGGAFGTSFTLTSTGAINIATVAGGTNYVASSAPAAVISHGPNGLGAYLPTGTQITTDATHTDELANSDGSDPFVSHDPGPDYDDMVTWLSPNALFNRLVAAGKLP